MSFFVYILASERNGTLYVGVTSDLSRRISQHRDSLLSNAFTSRYKVHQLVHVETFESIEQAIKREKQLKTWSREWKMNLIEKENLIEINK